MNKVKINNSTITMQAAAATPIRIISKWQNTDRRTKIDSVDTKTIDNGKYFTMLYLITPVKSNRTEMSIPQAIIFNKINGVKISCEIALLFYLFIFYYFFYSDTV